MISSISLDLHRDPRLRVLGFARSLWYAVLGGEVLFVTNRIGGGWFNNNTGLWRFSGNTRVTTDDGRPIITPAIQDSPVSRTTVQQQQCTPGRATIPPSKGGIGLRPPPDCVATSALCKSNGCGTVVGAWRVNEWVGWPVRVNVCSEKRLRAKWGV